ncbi:ribonuclease inhibitor [Snuella lapsa]|uniref:Ribonuclease inhibitor n=2 Tax=Snuella lapsa TaxID=870481 RepID=A0ABP6X9K1_9FLAO
MLELVGHYKKQPAMTSAIPLALLTGAISAAVACILGFMLSKSGDYEADVLNVHFWFGIATTGITFLAWLIRSEKINISKFEKGKHHISSLALIVVLLSVTGHYGGNLTHGDGYLTKYAPFGKKPIKELPQISKLEDAIVYDYLVNPILQNRCVSCHNNSKKKGGLSFQDTIAIQNGGKNGAAFVAGNAAKSEMIRRVLLDEHHEDVMPPEGKTPLTEEEVEIMKYWINNANADFSIKVGSVKTSEAIRSIASNMLKIEGVVEKSVETLPILSKINDEILNEVIASGFKVRELVFESNLYEIVLPTSTITEDNKDELDAKLLKLLKIKEHIFWLSLGDNSLNDSHLEVISQFKNLRKLNLYKNQITDSGVMALLDNESITSLNLYQTNVTKKSLDLFSKMKNLKRVYLWGTDIHKNDLSPYLSKEHFPEIVL